MLVAIRSKIALCGRLFTYPRSRDANVGHGVDNDNPTAGWPNGSYPAFRAEKRTVRSRPNLRHFDEVLESGRNNLSQGWDCPLSVKWAKRGCLGRQLIP